ncbi:MAG: prepilin-type cleavage/methylation domain-containing protein [Planctomycetota bacterium]
MIRRRGFSLLELFLTLSLAVVLMTLVNSAFRFYAVEMDQSDEDMRQTMLASAVMQMIEDDLRAAIHPEPLDTAALEELLANTAASVSGGAGAPGGGTGEQQDASLPPEEEGVMELASTVSVLETPGLIGNQFQVQLDTSRLPRLEEYVVMLDANPAKLQDIPSDVKTVTYYIQEAGMSGVDDPLLALDPTGDASQPAGGLVRRVIDRSAQNFAMVSGGLTSLQQTGELIAPEILAIEFSYWDGITWQLEWNSDEFGELPLAIKIQMQMASTSVGGDVNTLATAAAPTRVFQHIVRLPMAKVMEEDPDAAYVEESL